jgi:hypothetical protein
MDRRLLSFIALVKHLHLKRTTFRSLTFGVACRPDEFSPLIHAFVEAAVAGGKTIS